MAKRKTPKIKDLRPDKISSEQLDKLQKLVSDVNRIHMNIGNLESRKHDMLHGAFELNNAIMGLQKKFEEEYGTADINIQDGVINYK
tara:strand:+ start:788 stop:1048 length:261 start_codon:yes stop_codon:yes gene_type:complete